MIPALAGVALVAAFTPAQAADAPEAQAESVRGVGTFERDPIGIDLDRLINLPFDLEKGYDPDAERNPLSTFTVFPRFETDLVYSSNVYRTSSDESGDALMIYRPSLDIRSDWDNHSLLFSATLEEGRYFDLSTENYTDYTLLTALNLDVDDFTTASATLTRARSHGLRGDINDPGSLFEPTVQYRHSLDLRMAHNIPDGIQFEPSYRISDIWFRDNGPIDNSDRARVEHDVQARTGWEVQQGTVVFVQPRAIFTRYDQKFDAFGTQRDLDQYELTTGVSLDPSPIVFLEFLAGLTMRNFADPTLKDGTGILGRGRFIWNPSTLWTVTGSLDQTFEPASVAGVSGTMARTATLGVDWSPQDDIILGTSVRWAFQDIVGATPERTRDRYIFGLNGEWAINWNAYLSGSVTHEIQSGDQAVDELTEDRFQLRFGVAL